MHAGVARCARVVRTWKPSEWKEVCTKYMTPDCAAVTVKVKVGGTSKLDGGFWNAVLHLGLREKRERRKVKGIQCSGFMYVMLGCDASCT